MIMKNIKERIAECREGIDRCIEAEIHWNGEFSNDAYSCLEVVIKFLNDLEAES